MVPLTLAKIGEENSIKKINGREDLRQFLSALGFIPGAHVTIITAVNGSVIVGIKESRVAIGRETAAKIMV